MLPRISESPIEKKAGLQSLDEPWADTTSRAGKMIMTAFGGAEFKRTLILARTDEDGKPPKPAGRRSDAPQSCRRIKRSLSETSSRAASQFPPSL
ncbi:MAG: hypothetical protein OXC53_10265, partial [Rhodobacteraceae bacterium]|nr:hypothetical protein [Paracoccaceae bacterium]